MGMLKLSCAAVVALALAACGGEQKAEVAEKAPAKMTPGQYELTSEVTQLASTDNTTPATPLKVGDKQTVSACVPENGKPRPEFFAEMGQSPDKCEIKNDYVRNGRLSAQLSCKREGQRGDVMPAMMGSFEADSFEGEITTMTYFIAEGDYRMTRRVSAKRVGDCLPANTEKAT